jgi:hypothetical protein
MLRAPTKKSRMNARASVALVAVALVLDGWFIPPLPRLSIPVLGLGAFVMMQIAKQTRETEGVEIPAEVIKAGGTIANVEVSLGLVGGLCVFAVLAMGMAGVPTLYRQLATVGTLLLFAVTLVIFRFTKARFDALMKARGTDVEAN